MKRALAFLLLLLVFLVWTFPHRALVERLLVGRLGELRVDVALSDVTPAWPPGYRITDLELQRGPYSVRIDSLWLDLFAGGGLRFDADACGGILRGAFHMEPDQSKAAAARVPGKRIDLTFDRLDPASCMHTGSLDVSGSFAGEFRLDGIGHGSGGILGPVAQSGSLSVEASAGMIGGYLPAPPSRAGTQPSREGLPIGQWSFERAALDARLAGGDIVVDKADARAEGVEWRVDKAKLSPSADGGIRISGDFRARRLDDSGRSRAILGLLPKAGEDTEGWRHFRVAGTLAAPRITGMK